jgi:hypothetical protein
MNLRAAIDDLYAQVRAPDWAAPNLDGLADVLRDLGWLPEGPVEVHRPGGLGERDEQRLSRVLEQAVAETAAGPRPVRVRASGDAGRARDAH